MQMRSMMMRRGATTHPRAPAAASRPACMPVNAHCVPRTHARASREQQQQRRAVAVTAAIAAPPTTTQLRRAARSVAARSAAQQQQQSSPVDLADGSVSVILLAGGVGKRMGAPIPKQYLELSGQPIATYALETFSAMREVGEVVIVCDPSWRYVFEERLAGLGRRVPVKWALPGAERQDSVANGLAEVSQAAEIVAVHDSARPLVYPSDAARCMRDGAAVGAAVLGVPVKPTIKEVDKEMNVVKTLVRAALWEVQTPQCIRPALLREGFELVRQKGLEVTDDVSIIEAMGLPVKITPGSYTNIKVTTPDDMSVAVGFLEELAQQRAAAAAASGEAGKAAPREGAKGAATAAAAA